MQDANDLNGPVSDAAVALFSQMTDSNTDSDVDHSDVEAYEKMSNPSNAPQVDPANKGSESKSSARDISDIPTVVERVEALNASNPAPSAEGRNNPSTGATTAEPSSKKFGNETGPEEPEGANASVGTPRPIYIEEARARASNAAHRSSSDSGDAQAGQRQAEKGNQARGASDGENPQEPPEDDEGNTEDPKVDATLNMGVSVADAVAGGIAGVAKSPALIARDLVKGGGLAVGAGGAAAMATYNAAGMLGSKAGDKINDYRIKSSERRGEAIADAQASVLKHAEILRNSGFLELQDEINKASALGDIDAETKLLAERSDLRAKHGDSFKAVNEGLNKIEKEAPSHAKWLGGRAAASLTDNPKDKLNDFSSQLESWKSEASEKLDGLFDDNDNSLSDKLHELADSVTEAVQTAVANIARLLRPGAASTGAAATAG